MPRALGEASFLSSLTYFKPSSMSLTTPHPVWSFAETGFEVAKAVTVATVLSGRYVTDHGARHWSKVNPEGNCQLCLVGGHGAEIGTLEHQLLKYPALC